MEAQVIGIVARLDPLKGQRDSIEAFRQVARSHPTARLLVVGDKVEVSGTSREDLEAQARRTGFHDRIIFSGYRADLARVFSALDIFIHPSRREALGFAPAEASGAGLPVVAYAEGGTLEIIRHGRTGLLASPGKVDELALHLGTLLDDPSRARQMGLAGREWFGKHFQCDPACLAFLSLLAEVSRGGGDHARAAGQPVRFGIRGN
jgi:glycosyltransferase involved in cell wall biosynthesis